jgi:hypothetical protein
MSAIAGNTAHERAVAVAEKVLKNDIFAPIQFRFDLAYQGLDAIPIKQGYSALSFRIAYHSKA